MFLQWRRSEEGEAIRWFWNGDDGEERRWFCNGEEGEERAAAIQDWARGPARCDWIKIKINLPFN